MEIHALKGHRWFIWAITITLVSGALLVTYINYTSATGSENDLGPVVVHHPSKAMINKHKTSVTHSATVH